MTGSNNYHLIYAPIVYLHYSMISLCLHMILVVSSFMLNVYHTSICPTFPLVSSEGVSIFIFLKRNINISLAVQLRWLFRFSSPFLCACQLAFIMFNSFDSLSLHTILYCLSVLIPSILFRSIYNCPYPYLTCSWVPSSILTHSLRMSPS